jgi:hypothetical protein
LPKILCFKVHFFGLSQIGILYLTKIQHFELET